MTSVTEPILLSSGEESDDDVMFESLADERPPSDEDYESSITLSSGEDVSEDDNDGDVEIDEENVENTNEKVENISNAGEYYSNTCCGFYVDSL